MTFLRVGIRLSLLVEHDLFRKDEVAEVIAAATVARCRPSLPSGFGAQLVADPACRMALGVAFGS
jgi:hypothetical protein